jgi:hypothetical protein
MPPVEAECVGSPTDAGGGAAEGIRERIHNRETSRLSRRCTAANFLRAVLLGRELINSPG